MTGISSIKLENKVPVIGTGLVPNHLVLFIPCGINRKKHSFFCITVVSFETVSLLQFLSSNYIFFLRSLACVHDATCEEPLAPHKSWPWHYMTYFDQ